MDWRHVLLKAFTSYKGKIFGTISSIEETQSKQTKLIGSVEEMSVAWGSTRKVGELGNDWDCVQGNKRNGKNITESCKKLETMVEKPTYSEVIGRRVLVPIGKTIMPEEREAIIIYTINPDGKTNVDTEMILTQPGQEDVTGDEEQSTRLAVTWSKFVNHDLPNNPWGVVNKLLAEKLKMNSQETLTEILEWLMPLDE